MSISTEKGRKDDTGKALVALVEPEFLEGMANVLTFGATKYGLYNWKNNLETHRIESALLRHYIEYKKGYVSDSETGLSHLLHLAVNAMFLYWYQQKELADKGYATDKEVME